MCAGKSRLGRLAAQRLGWPLADSDKLLEERFGEPIATFFDREGEQAFRDREQELVLELLAAPARRSCRSAAGPSRAGRCASALAGHDVVLRRGGCRGAWERARKIRSPAGARPRALRAAARGRGARCTSRWPALVLADGAREDAGVRGRAASRQRRAAHGVVGAGLPRVGGRRRAGCGSRSPAGRRAAVS